MTAQGILTLTKDTRIAVWAERTPPLEHALRMIDRDHEMVLGRKPNMTDAHDDDADIVVRYAASDDDCPQWPEAFGFRFAFRPNKTVLHIVGRDELGLVYGLLEYSHRVLGVDPLWFWADLSPERKETVSIPIQNWDSKKPKVRYRGWFVNDEVCLIGWSQVYPPSRDVWMPVFECLLRLGGNMVIPGTDLPKTGVHASLALEMGLWLTHHHAEPLGAEMFLRSFPGRKPSYRDHPDLFEALWKEAIDKQKGQRIVWSLSFRGQGDKPFWEDDPSFDTPEKRGAMISRVVRKQYEMIRESERNPVCCMALYGEIAELYKAGHLEVPDDVILVWADNGYGKMVSRRQGNRNLRIPALPDPGDARRHGIYYHVTFHDLQASNHLTMFPSSPDLIVSELNRAFHAGADEYLLVNSGNIRPHVYTLDLVSHIWHDGEVDREQHMRCFVERMYSSQHESICELHNRFFTLTIPYGPHEDEHAGDEFYHHPARQIIAHWIQERHDETQESLIWATGKIPFAEQVAWFKQKVAAAIPGWKRLDADCRRVMRQLSKDDAQRLSDHLLFHITLHLSGCLGFYELCRSYEQFRKGNYPLAFVHASRSLWNYKKGRQSLNRAEHGKWKRFFRADWLTNIQNTMDHLESLRRLIRIHGDSPDMFLWYREFLMPETEKHIYLENTHRRPLSNDDLARRLLRYFSEKRMIDFEG